MTHINVNTEFVERRKTETAPVLAVCARVSAFVYMHSSVVVVQVPASFRLFILLHQIQLH